LRAPTVLGAATKGDTAPFAIALFGLLFAAMRLPPSWRTRRD
jgi:hypothetical protein